MNFAYGLAHYKVLWGQVEEQHPNDWDSNPNRDSRQVACFHFEFSLARSLRYFVLRLDDYFDIGITPLDWKAFYFPFSSNWLLRWPLYNI